MIEKEIKDQNEEIDVLQSTDREHEKSNCSLLDTFNELHKQVASLTAERDASWAELAKLREKLAAKEAELEAEKEESEIKQN